MLGRAGSLVRMLEHAGIPFEYKSSFPDLASKCSSFGAIGDTFAPPLVEDGDFIISQSTACALYIGRKCNFIPPAAADEAKAFQYVCDLIDLFENGIANAKGKGGAELKIFLESDRFRAMLGNVERSIRGPFYFGEVSYVDFLLCALYDWAEETLFNRLRADKGVDVFLSASKMREVVSRIHNFESYQNSNFKTSREGYECKDDLVAQYV